MTRQPLDGQLALPLVPELPAVVRVELAAWLVPGWQTQAACADTDPVLFDPPADDPVAGPANSARARSICHDCPVRRSCLFTALLDDEAGIWGGHDDTSRDQIRQALADPRRRDAVLGPNQETRNTKKETAA